MSTHYEFDDLENFNEKYLNNVEDDDYYEYEEEDDYDSLYRVWLDYSIEGDEDYCIVYASTNDNDDDGFPDGGIEFWELVFTRTERADALEIAQLATGVSRVGLSGIDVCVRLNGERID